MIAGLWQTTSRADHHNQGNDMDFKTFDELVERETKRMKDVMCSKSADYSADDDKLFNFKLAAELDGVSPIEALRGMWLKHRTSLRQGLDELIDGKPCRSEDWWIEKLTDDRNYSILLQALLVEKYFNNESEEVDEFTIKKAEDTRKGWYIIVTRTRKPGLRPMFLWRNLTLVYATGWNPNYPYGSAPGYYRDKTQAMAVIELYKNKPFVVPEGWKIAEVNKGVGWTIRRSDENFVWKDLSFHYSSTEYSKFLKEHNCKPEYGEAPGYWPTEGAAKEALKQYLAKESG